MLPHALCKVELFCYTLFSKKQIMLPITKISYLPSSEATKIPYADIFVQKQELVAVFHDVNGVFSPYVRDLLIATLSFGES